MHYINHNFTDWDFDTKHMNRIEKTIYLDLRSLYFSTEKAIDASDMKLLERRTLVTNEDEKQALAFVLKDKFKKTGKFYKCAAWDKIIKDYKYQEVVTAVGDMAKRLKANGEAIQADTGTVAIRELYIKSFGHDKLTRITNGTNADTNETTNDTNERTNALTNAERQAKSTAERKHMVDSLKSIGKSVTLRTSIAKLRELYADNFNNDDVSKNTNEVTNTNGTNADTNETTNDTNAKKDAITINHEPLTINQEPKNSNNNSASDFSVIDSIADWIHPELTEINAMLILGAPPVPAISQADYDHQLVKFKNYYAEKEIEGSYIRTEGRRKDMLTEWIKRDYIRQQKIKSQSQPARFNIDNEDWSGTTASKSESHDSDLPSVYHPSHSKPATQAKPNPSTSVMVNGLWKEPLPGMSVQQTYDHISQQHMPGEMQDETYDRLLNQMQETV